MDQRNAKILKLAAMAKHGRDSLRAAEICLDVERQLKKDNPDVEPIEFPRPPLMYRPPTRKGKL